MSFKESELLSEFPAPGEILNPKPKSYVFSTLPKALRTQEKAPKALRTLKRPPKPLRTLKKPPKALRTPNKPPTALKR